MPESGSAVTVQKKSTTGAAVGTSVLRARKGNDSTYYRVYTEDDALQTDGKLSGSNRSYTLKLAAGETYLIRAEGLHQVPEWITKNGKIAAVSEYGVVFAERKGKVKLSAKINGKTTTINVQVSGTGGSVTGEALDLQTVEAINGNVGQTVSVTGDGSFTTEEVAAGSQDVPQSKLLVAFFSRGGQNYNVGSVKKGNTKIIAEMIADITGADLYEIKVKDSYPSNYKKCVSRAQKEQEENARPALVNLISEEKLAQYDTVFLGYPIWHGDLPMPLYTFLESVSLDGKLIAPFNTHEGSGDAGTPAKIQAKAANATLLSNLAIQGKIAQKSRTQAESSTKDWAAQTLSLRKARLENSGEDNTRNDDNTGNDQPTPTEEETASLVTNGGTEIAFSALTHLTEAESASTVYYISDISSEALLSIYQALDWKPTGKVAVKVSTGESEKSNYLRGDLIVDLVQSVDGTIVECNTAYGGNRSSTALHEQIAKDHGFTDVSKGGVVDIMDADGSMSIPVTGGSRLTEDLVGAHFANYNSFLILSHFKGHAMAGFGGAIKNISIGIGSSEGKILIHTGGRRSTGNIWNSDQDSFLEAMAEAGKGVSDYLGNGERIVYINVMNRLSVDCDCDGNPAEPDMHDIGILASYDPVAIDQACVDLVYAAPDGDSMRKRIERQSGIHTLEHAEEIGLGSRSYRLTVIK